MSQHGQNRLPAHVRRVVVVGGGPAAHRLADAIAARDATDGSVDLDVTVLGDEPHLPYDRVALSRRLDDPTADLTLADGTVWDRPGIRYCGANPVVAIDPTARTVQPRRRRAGRLRRTRARDRVARDGARHSRRRAGRVYRTIDDVDCARRARWTRPAHDASGAPANVVVVGGGLLGLEAAGGLARLGGRVTRRALGRAGSCRPNSMRAPARRSAG